MNPEDRLNELVGGAWPNGVALVSEAWPSISRPMVAGFTGMAANVGQVIFSVLTCFVVVTASSWRWVMALGTVPLVLAVSAVFLRHESRNWLGQQSLGECVGERSRREESRGRSRAQSAGLAGPSGSGNRGKSGWLPLSLPEMFPTRVRATGAGVSFNFGRIATAAGILVVAGMLKSVFGGDYSRIGMFTSGIDLIGAIVVWLAPSHVTAGESGSNFSGK